MIEACKFYLHAFYIGSGHLINPTRKEIYLYCEVRSNELLSFTKIACRNRGSRPEL